MKIYIAGPMTGIENLNATAFHAAAASLRALGHEVVNPAELNPDTSKSWVECMKVDIAQLVTCDAVVALPGWTASEGAMIKTTLAGDLAITVYMLSELCPEGVPA